MPFGLRFLVKVGCHFNRTNIEYLHSQGLGSYVDLPHPLALSEVFFAFWLVGPVVFHRFFLLSS